MAKSVFQAGKEKQARRKAFVEEVKVDIKIDPTARSVFKAGRAKAARREEFTAEAKKAGKKAGNRRMTKDPDTRPKTLKRGRRAGQTAGQTAGDKSKPELYKEATALKKKKGDTQTKLSYFDKKQLQAYILKHS
jgi:hypothetical protein